MSEYIKREDAIIEIERFAGYFDDDMIYRIKLALNRLPSEVKPGEWINDIRYPGWTCSECGDHEGNKTDKYCHNCGAKMDKEQEYEKEIL